MVNEELHALLFNNAEASVMSIEAEVETTFSRAASGGSCSELEPPEIGTGGERSIMAGQLKNICWAAVLYMYPRYPLLCLSFALHLLLHSH